MSKKFILLLISIFLGTQLLSAQEFVHSEFTIDFRVNSTKIDRNYLNNAKSLDSLDIFLDKVDSLRKTTRFIPPYSLKLVSVSFYGVASPEGSGKVNRNLSLSRLKRLEEYVRSRVEIEEDIIIRDENHISWDRLISEVEVSDISYKEEILAILNGPAMMVENNGNPVDSRVLELQKLNKGRVWRELNTRFFNGLRNAEAVFTFEKIPVAAPIEAMSYKAPVLLSSAPKSISAPSPVVEQASWTPELYVKANGIGLGLFVVNAGVEYQFAPAWSVNLPVFFSAVDYFSTQTKFRMFLMQPEVRYWLQGLKGFYLGVHLGGAMYNVATGDYRIQDHRGGRPGFGGGLGVGYRLPISENGKWLLEFGLGAGVYNLHYDRFHNTPDVSQGAHFDTIKRTWFGIDIMNFSLVYKFGNNNNGGGER